MRGIVTIDVLLPLLYLKGIISTTDFADSFEIILGSKPKNLSPNVISIPSVHRLNGFEFPLLEHVLKYVYLVV
jgi:hypothetical protein